MLLNEYILIFILYIYMKELSYKTKELCEKNKRYNKFNTVLPSVFNYKNLIKNVINKNNFMIIKSLEKHLT